jgi:hypothetical protein
MMLLVLNLLVSLRLGDFLNRQICPGKDTYNI